MLGIARQRPILMGCVAAIAAGLIVFLVLRDGNDDPREEPLQVDSWAALQERIYRAGGPTPELALEAFATVFGPVPGVEVEDQDVRLPPHMSGTGAVALVLGFWDSYTPAQRAAIGRVLFEPLNRNPSGLSPPQTIPPHPKSVNGRDLLRPVPGAGRPRLVARAVGGRQRDGSFALDRSPAGGDPVLVDEPTLSQLVTAGRTIQAALATRLGRRLNHPVRWFLPDDPTLRAADVTMAVPVVPALVRYGMPLFWRKASENDPWTCAIHITQGHLQLGARELASIMAHELFHCYQWDVNWALTEDYPAWLMEGSARWVGEAYVGGSPRSRQDWRDYQTVTRSLFARSYDAIGFFSQMTKSGIDTWHGLIPMLLTDSGDAAFSRVTGGPRGLNLMETWPMSIANDPSLGRDWVLEGPGSGHLRSLDFDDARYYGAGRWSVSADPGMQWLAVIRLDEATVEAPAADAVTVDVTGYGGLQFGQTHTQHRFSGRFTATYCLRGTCTCPGGGRPPGILPNPSPPEDPWFLALTGTLESAQADIMTQSLAEVCPPSASGAAKGDGPEPQPMPSPRDAAFDRARCPEHAEAFPELERLPAGSTPRVDCDGDFVLIHYIEGCLARFGQGRDFCEFYRYVWADDWYGFCLNPRRSFGALSSRETMARIGRGTC